MICHATSDEDMDYPPCSVCGDCDHPGDIVANHSGTWYHSDCFIRMVRPDLLASLSGVLTTTVQAERIDGDVKTQPRWCPICGEIVDTSYDLLQLTVPEDGHLYHAGCYYDDEYTTG